MERFANSVVKGQAILKKKEEVQDFVDVLIGNLPVSEEVPSEPVPAVPRKPTPVDKLVKSTKKLGLSARQWIMLGAMAFFEALIIIFIFVLVTVVFG
jgi:hypothetical protein